MHTTILHNVRKLFSLSCNAYCVADMVQKLSGNPNAPAPGWCSMSREHMADVLDLTKRTVINIVNELIEKDLIERNPETNYLRHKAKWYDAVVEEIEKKTSEKTSQGVKKLHTSTGGEKITPPVKNVHGEGEKISPDASEKISPYNNNIDNDSKKVVEPQATYRKPPNIFLEAIYENELLDLLGPEKLQKVLYRISAAKSKNPDTKGSDYAHAINWAIKQVEDDEKREALPIGYDVRLHAKTKPNLDWIQQEATKPVFTGVKRGIPD